MAPDQIASIAAEIAVLDAMPADRHLERIKARVIETGGTWDLPAKDPATYDPLLKTIQLHGIFAMAERLDELAKNWLKAARTTLDAHNEAVAAE